MIHDESWCASRRQSNTVSQNAKQAVRISGICPVIAARRVKGWTGAITASKPAPSKSIVRPNAD